MIMEEILSLKLEGGTDSKVRATIFQKIKEYRHKLKKRKRIILFMFHMYYGLLSPKFI